MGRGECGIGQDARAGTTGDTASTARNAAREILCLTYTKAAAANMANRVFGELAKWTPLSDDELDAEIVKIEGRRPDALRRLRARRLFAQALDTPGGLKVQTIHAFCTRLLHQFPFEADVAARFEVLEERTQSELIDRQRMAVLLKAAAEPDSHLGRALSVAITAAADMTFNEMIVEAIARRDELIAWVANAGGVRGGDRGPFACAGHRSRRNQRDHRGGISSRSSPIAAIEYPRRDRSAGAGIKNR